MTAHNQRKSIVNLKLRIKDALSHRWQTTSEIAEVMGETNSRDRIGYQLSVLAQRGEIEWGISKVTVGNRLAAKIWRRL